LFREVVLEEFADHLTGQGQERLGGPDMLVVWCLLFLDELGEAMDFE